MKKQIDSGMRKVLVTVIYYLSVILAALLLFISGLILSTLQEKDRRDFEFQLQQVNDQYRRLIRDEA